MQFKDMPFTSVSNLTHKLKDVNAFLNKQTVHVYHICCVNGLVSDFYAVDTKEQLVLTSMHVNNNNKGLNKLQKK